jgi:hypothetical protein
MITSRGNRPLADDEGLNGLFRAWLSGDPLLGRAADDWRLCLEVPAAAAGSARAWRDDGWRGGWLEQSREDLPDDEDRLRLERNAGLLAAGEADVIVTGQQPGFLGGPLYTLYKLAAAVAAAKSRTAAGRRTLPLFWSGDDDDDSREAFQPLIFDPRRRILLRAQAPTGPADRMVGAAPASDWGRGEAGWLAEAAAGGGLASDLSALWQAAFGVRLGWGRLHRRALLRVFRHTDLLVVSGNDAVLHELAAPFYRDIWRRRAELADLIAARGEELSAAGFHAQIGEQSSWRLLHVEKDGRRLSLETGEDTSLPAAGSVRPGVAARSLVQDWLFGPAAVVIGPAELAYLKQLEPVYRALSLPRAPLLPRLFAWLGPAAWTESAETAEAAAGSALPDERRLAAAAEKLRLAVEPKLRDALRTAAGSPADRAYRLAAQLAERWQTTAAELLAREWRRLQAGAAKPPIWLSPLGRRQERTLASHWATALFGDEFSEALTAAAHAHFEFGAGGVWRRMKLIVPDIGHDAV